MGSQVEVGQVYLRLAVPQDVGHIRELIWALARFEKLEHECVADDPRLLETLFDDPTRPPFKGPTVVMLEVGNGPQAAAAVPVREGEHGWGEEEEVQPYGARTGEGPALVSDPDRALFASKRNPHRTVAAFALVFPNYSTFLARPGLYLEDLFVREQYRRCGLGTRLLRFLARVAHKRSLGRLEWSVLDWNAKAIQFYTERMGARLMAEWRICRLEGPTLEAAAKAEDE